MKKQHFGLQWHITNRCDQRCKHCYIYNGNENISEDDKSLSILLLILDDFIFTCERLGKSPYLTITGGDPLLHKDIWKFLENICSRNIPFSILGNPFHLTEGTVKELEKLGCVYYQMSLDGLPETHDYIRKPGSFYATIEAMKLFENTSIRTGIMSTVSKKNIEEIPELLEFLVGYKINSYAFARYCPNKDDLDMMVNATEYRNLLEKMWKKYTKYQDGHMLFPLKDHLWKLYLYEIGLFNPDDYINPNDLILDGCHCGISHMTILANGDVYACRRSDTLVGKVPDESLYDIFTGQKMSYYRQYDLFEACKDCKLRNFCRGCPSVAKCYSGDFYSKDPQCWKA